MKVCQYCGEEIGTRDGDNLCRSCEDAIDEKDKAKKAKAKAKRKAKAEIMKSLGLVKVKGALGGTYWE